MLQRFLTFILLTGMACQAHAFGGFHPPSNPLEGLVASAIKQLNHDPAWPRYLLYHPKADETMDAVNSQMFTQELLQDWQEQEARSVYMRCGGEYIPGRQCGFSYNPLTCLTFIPQYGYAFRTDSAAVYSDGAYNAQVSMRIAGGQQLVASYILKQVGKMWLIDGVECHVENDEFNMD